MKSLNTWMVNLVKDEFKSSESVGKWLIVVAVANLPLPDVFLPYFTQAITIILMSIFLKKYNSSPKENSRIVIGISITIMIVQLFWFPYISQLVTLVLLGVLYGVFTKYNKS